MIKLILFFILTIYGESLELQSQSVQISDETTSKNTVWSSAKISAAIATGATSASLNDLTDVDVSNPQDGQLLGYVEVDGVWEATSNASLESLTADYIDFSTGSSPDCTYGRVYFDGDGTMSVCMETDGVIQQVGMEQYYYVRNNSGSLIGDGDAVMFTGTLGSSGKITVASARADEYFYARFAVGVATQDIPNNADGFVTFSGAVKGVQTNGSDVGETWNDGDVIYVNPDSAGKLTTTTPEPPNARIVMGVVVYAHENQGILGIRVKEQGLLNDLHDFYQSNSASGDVIRRDSTNQYWENTSAVSIVGNDLTVSSGTVTATSFAISTDYLLPPSFAANDFDDVTAVGVINVAVANTFVATNTWLNSTERSGFVTFSNDNTDYSTEASDGFIIDTKGSGMYMITADMSYGGTGNAITQAHIFVNGVIKNECGLERKLGAGGDVGNAGLSCIIDLNVGDFVDIRFTSNGTDTINISHGTMAIHRVSQ